MAHFPSQLGEPWALILFPRAQHGFTPSGLDPSISFQVSSFAGDSCSNMPMQYWRMILGFSCEVFVQG